MNKIPIVPKKYSNEKNHLYKNLIKKAINIVFSYLFALERRYFKMHIRLCKIEKKN